MAHRPVTAPKCKIDNYGLARKNSLIGITQKLNARCYELQEDKKTIWLTTESEKIGLEKKHIEELGIDIHKFFEPAFEQMQSPQSQKIETVACSAIEQDEQTETSTLTAQRVELSSNYLVRLEMFKGSKVHHGHSNNSNNKQLGKLLNNENIQLISCQELKNKMNTTNQNITGIPNKILKDNETAKTLRNKKKTSCELLMRANNRPKLKEKVKRKIIETKKEDGMKTAKEDATISEIEKPCLKIDQNQKENLRVEEVNIKKKEDKLIESTKKIDEIILVETRCLRNEDHIQKEEDDIRLIKDDKPIIEKENLNADSKVTNEFQFEKESDQNDIYNIFYQSIEATNEEDNQLVIDEDNAINDNINLVTVNEPRKEKEVGLGEVYQIEMNDITTQLYEEKDNDNKLCRTDVDIKMIIEPLNGEEIQSDLSNRLLEMKSNTGASFAQSDPFKEGILEPSTMIISYVKLKEYLLKVPKIKRFVKLTKSNMEKFKQILKMLKNNKIRKCQKNYKILRESKVNKADKNFDNQLVNADQEKEFLTNTITSVEQALERKKYYGLKEWQINAHKRTNLIQFIKYLKVNLKHGNLDIAEKNQYKNLIKLMTYFNVMLKDQNMLKTYRSKNIIEVVMNIIKARKTLNIKELKKLLKFNKQQKKRKELLIKVAKQFNKSVEQIAIVKGLTIMNPLVKIEHYYWISMDLRNFYRQCARNALSNCLRTFYANTPTSLQIISDFPARMRRISSSYPMYHRVDIITFEEPSPSFVHFLPCPRLTRRIAIDLSKPFLPFKPSVTSKYEVFQELLVWLYGIVLIPIVFLMIANTPELFAIWTTLLEYTKNVYDLKLCFPKLFIFVQNLFRSL